jgi:hypothetical protein
MNDEDTTSPLPAWLALSAITIAIFILIYSHL